MNSKSFLLMLSALIQKDFELEPKLTQKFNHYQLIINKGPNYQYWIRLNNSDINIYSVKTVTKSANGRIYIIPEYKILLSVDLHDPRSLKTILGWLKTL